MYNNTFKSIQEMEESIHNFELLANEAAYYGDEKTVSHCEESIRTLTRKLAILKKEWADSEDTLVYSCQEENEKMNENSYIQTPSVVARDCGYPQSVILALQGLNENDTKAIRILRDARRGIYPDSALTKQTTEKPKHIVRTNHSRVFSQKERKRKNEKNNQKKIKE